MVTCPRCKREAVGWPLSRHDVCSPKDWVKCIREPEVIRQMTKAPAKSRRRRLTLVPLDATCMREAAMRHAKREAFAILQRLRADGISDEAYEAYRKEIARWKA